MLKQITFTNWKSFQEATLYIDPLTALIGTNASGKSNVLDGLEFLRRVSTGIDVESALDGGRRNKEAIEDVDNGLHPSRARMLLDMLREIGHQRHIDVLVTTHSPALLDAMERDMLPFITVAHRNPHTGESTLTLLENIDNLPKLLASGSPGQLIEQGAIERGARASLQRGAE